VLVPVSAFWVDANGHATTTTGPDRPQPDIARPIHVARGFTASQYCGAVYDLPAVNQPIRKSTTNDASYYETQLVRAVESVLSPLGWDRTEICRELAETQEMNVTAFTEVSGD